MEYKEINLRDFRHNLTQLRDSGNAYAVLKKGKIYGYFIPPEYEIKIVNKKNKVSREKFFKILERLQKNPIEFKDEVRDAKDGMEAYHRLLDIEYGDKSE